MCKKIKLKKGDDIQCSQFDSPRSTIKFIRPIHKISSQQYSQANSGSKTQKQGLRNGIQHAEMERESALAALNKFAFS